ncbi:cerebellar degeneration-related protein 2-like [Sinocyclocheilus grahami]|uniref:cerebellar degeneration-related protein 2-like n=1 Tax=Sinocyclocheilus grahami TaxID=75366 RepID=UPI0007AD686A|nr:PREDICTED: cerebellar degeneration-related protein 2-like [Sinocyclocheilus grahami]
MLTDITEGEFDIKEEEPWYDHQDLEHDLHLAAELGKNLLEQNRDLEETLQQMYISNQEQIQEIEYLSKQVDLLRSVNDQHAKVYEQLDLTAQDLELKNQRLVLENRAAQLKIEGLTETVEGLQTQVEELQRDMQKKETCQLHDYLTKGSDFFSPCCMYFRCFSHKHSVSTSRSSLKREEQDKLWELERSVDSLQAQLSTERSQREAAELEADALAHELIQLEPREALLGVYKERLAETEAEVQELRLLLRSSKDNVDIPLDDEAGGAGHRGRSLRCCSSERQLLSNEQPEGQHHGISLLNEMDAQYAALQEKYDTLLRRCQDGKLPENQKTAQTHTNTQNDSQQPEYKALFQEIFSFIQKSKKDLKENRIKPSQAE